MSNIWGAVQQRRIRHLFRTNAKKPSLPTGPFASAPYSVNLATEYKSLTHYTKGTQSHRLLCAPTACMYTVSGSFSLPSPGFFSPFPHGTGSLSVSQEYLALEDGPPIFRQDTTCPALLIELTICAFLCTGLSPCIARLSRRFH